MLEIWDFLADRRLLKANLHRLNRLTGSTD